MSRLLVSVTARNEEHGGTIRHSCKHSTGGNSSAGWVDLAATSGVARKSTTMTAGIAFTRVGVVLVGRGAASAVWELAVW